MGLFSSIARTISSALGSTLGRAVTSMFGVGSVVGTILGAVTALTVTSGLNSLIGNRNTSVARNKAEDLLKNKSAMVKQPVTPRETVYGSTKKSGTILFTEATDKNKRLHILVELASHEIQSVDKVYFNDEELTLFSTAADRDWETRLFLIF